MTDPDLQQLLSAWLGGGSDGEALERAVERLHGDDVFRQAFVDEILMQGKLRAVQSGPPRWLALEDELGAAAHDSARDDFCDRVMSAVVGEHSDAHASRRVGMGPNAVKSVTLALLAVVLMVAGGTGMWRFSATTSGHVRLPAPESTAEASGVLPVEEFLPSRRRSLPFPVAVLTRAVDVHWNGSDGPSTGSTLEPRRLRLRAGIIQIDFFRGASLLVRGPADLELREADEVFVHSGDVTCYVSEVGRGFRINTRDLNVVDLGTAFGLHVQEGGSPEVHVLDGKVTVTNRTEGVPVELVTNEAVCIESGVLRATPFDPARFPHSTELTSRIRASAAERYLTWKAECDRLNQDSSVLVHFTFEDQDSDDLEVLNRAISPRRGSHGMVIGCRRTQGRWPGKSAMNFRGENDRVLFKVPGMHEEITFAVWARVDALMQKHTVLLLTEGPAFWNQHGMLTDAEIEAATGRRSRATARDFYWSIHQDGEVQGHLKVMPTGKESLRWREYHGGQPLMTSDRWGEWTCLALTYDAASGQIIHYWNGRPTLAQRIEDPVPLLLELMELGNLSNGITDVQYRFYGCFDEVLIANRAFSAEELARFYFFGLP